MKIAIGSRFGKLTITNTHAMKNGRFAICQCDCGNKRVVPHFDLMSGNIVSCDSGKCKHVPKGMTGGQAA